MLSIYFVSSSEITFLDTATNIPCWTQETERNRKKEVKQHRSGSKVLNEFLAIQQNFTMRAARLQANMDVGSEKLTHFYFFKHCICIVNVLIDLR